MSFPSYPKYKDSGVEWLGKVPEHWGIRKVRHICTIKKRIAGDLGYDVLSITQQGIRIRDIESNDGQLSMDYSKYQLVEIGDFAMNHMDLLTGYVDISRVRGVTSPDYRVFSISDGDISDAEYVLYVFQMGYKNRIFFAYGQGSSQLGRWRLPTDQFNELPFPFPPRNEQRLIAGFVAHETEKIDVLVAEHQRLIELLGEKRQAVISHAVTKGMNPNAPMKHSGIQWLGDVPAHWDIRAVKRIADLRSGDSITAERIEEIGEYPVLGGNGFRGYASGFTHEGDYVVIGRQGALCGNINYGSGRFWASEHAVVASPRVPVQTLWLGEMLRSMNLNQHSVSAAQPGLSVEFVGNLKMCLPPLNEQRAIATFIEGEMSELKALTSESQRAIALLQVRRTALISAAVTGKIDVRSLVGARAA